MADGLYNAIVENMAKDVLNRLDLTKRVTHAGESGRARERIISRFFADLLPDDLGVSTGFIVDAHGSVSRQIDVVIYRTDYHPVLQIGDVNHFLIESVVAVVENKARIASNDSLKEALENIASVKALDRTNGGTNRVLEGPGHGGPVTDHMHEHRILGIVTTERSLTTQTLLDGLVEDMQTRPQAHWINHYVDVNRFTVKYAAAHGASTKTSPVLTLFADEEGGMLPLADLALELTSFVQNRVLIDFNPVSYFGQQLPEPTVRHVWPDAADAADGDESDPQVAPSP